MNLLTIVTTVLTVIFFGPANLAGQEGDEKERPTGVTLGLKGKLGYGPMQWYQERYSNLPASLRYVASQGRTFENNTLNWNPRFMLPLNIGPAINFGNRLEVSAGSSTGFVDTGKDRFQWGCYCVGSTVTYMHYSVNQFLLGGYGDVALRMTPNTWLATEAAFYPRWMGINIRQGYSAYGGDETLSTAPFGHFRVPWVFLVGGKWKGFYENYSSMGGSVMVGVAKWQFRVNDFPDVQYSPGAHVVFVQIGVEGDFFRGKFSKRPKR